MYPTYNYYSKYEDQIGFALNGKLYYGLGYDPTGIGSYTGSLVKYDPATNTVSYAGSMNYAGHWDKAIGFSIGSYGYFGLGGDGTLLHDTIYKYDPVTEQIWQVTTFPGGPRYSAFAFTVNGKAYVGGGYQLGSGNHNDLWAYDPVTNAWSAKANCPMTIHDGVSFSIGDKGYLMTGGSHVLMEYTPSTNTWATRAPYPGSGMSGLCAFTINGVGYVGCGTDLGNTVSYQDMYTYDPVTNTWAPAPSLWQAKGRHHSVALSVGSTGYIIGGAISASQVYQDVWMFGPATTPAPNTWTQRPFVPGNGWTTAFAFAIGDKGYAGGGGSTRGFFRYDPTARTWTACAQPPANTDAGFSIGNKGYAITTSATQNFWEYDPVANTWTMRADLPGGARENEATFAVEGKGYVCGGWINNGRVNDMWAYDPGADTWTQRASIGSAKHWATGFSIGNKGYIAGGNIAGSSTGINTVACYDPVLNTWTAQTVTPMTSVQAAQAFVIGTKVWLGGGFTNGPTFTKRCDVYDPVTNVWSQVADLGGYYRYDGRSFSIGDKGYILGGMQDHVATFPFVLDFQPSNEMWEYNPETVSVSPRATLEGPFDQASGLMNDALRAASLLPRTDPYGAIGYPYPGGEYSDRPFTLPATTGNDAIVDRVIVELRNATTPFAPIASRSVWLQRDGDVVDIDGTSPVRFTVPPGSYQVAIRHRDHLGAMTLNPVALSATPVIVDLSAPSTQTYGTNARKTVGSKAVLWAGDVNFDGVIKYTGANNDRDPILFSVGGSTPNATVSGQYRREDVNMDGSVKYAGANNDRDIILTNVGSNTPNAVRTAQLP